MSKINQIENALKELDGGAFQKLANSYLLKRGYPQIKPTGSVAGSNKVKKGTPDTLIQTEDGKYIFCEYTTISENKVYSKFCDDLTKCLDENKTGVAISKIKEIVLCCTSDLSIENIDKLSKRCQIEEVNLNLFGLGAISYDLLEKYPSIAKDYLGIEVDTGQIVPLNDFISWHEENKLTTTLETSFHFREEEKSNLLSLINDNSLVIVTGKAGVGKTRIAIECYRQFTKENKKYKAYCIFNRECNLFEDIKSYFSNSGYFLIFVDDANRISGFQYIVQLLQTKRDNQNFKIIVTVRDYALDKIRETCQPIKVSSEINIKPFTNEEIKKLVQEEFEIKNQSYLDRIVSISHGNPRIAVMAAQVAKDSNTFNSIRDVSEIYDKYFSSIKSDLDALKDGTILKVAGIVAFFRSVDITNNNLMSDIGKIFDISAEDFEKASKKLHEMEVLDMFENEVVKISDQVFSTYLFYLVFFKEKLIDFSILIDKDLFPQYKRRLVDAISPILNTFNLNETKQTMEISVDKVWEQIQAKDEGAFLQLIDVFCFLKPTETLIFIQNEIRNYDSQKIPFDDIKFEKNSISSLPKFLSALSQFRHYREDDMNISLDLFLQYAKKQPGDTPDILHFLIDRYGFQPESYRDAYHVQHAVVDKILECSSSGGDEYFTRMFIALSGDYLHTHFSSTKSGIGHTDTVSITPFDVVASDELFKLREKILTNLFSLYGNMKYQQYILKLILSYTQSGDKISVGEIIVHDSKQIALFFNDKLDPNNLYHCVIVQQYLRLLKRFNIPVKEELKIRFKSSSYVLYDLLTNKLEKKRLAHSQDQNAYRRYEKKEIAGFMGSYAKENYDEILHELFNILETLEGYSKWQINQGVIAILEELAIRNPSLFCEVIKNYLQQGEYLTINPSIVVSNLISSFGSIVSLAILTLSDYPTKNLWLFSYYQHLLKKDIKQKQIDALSKLYQISDYKHFTHEVDYLLRYEAIKKGFVAEIVQIISDRSRITPEFACAVSLMFRKHTKINKQLPSLFSSRPELLENTYIAVDKVKPQVDYDGVAFSKLLDNNQGFINRYLEDRFSQNKCLNNHDERDYSFIWLRDDYLSVMQRISEVVFKYRQKDRCFVDYYDDDYLVFLKEVANSQTDESILERQDEYFLGEICSEHSKKKYMHLLFSVIVNFESKRKITFYKTFLEKNTQFEDFKDLPFEPMPAYLSGSAVPMLQKKIDFYKKIIPLCNSAELLEHKQYIEQRIRGIRYEIRNEKKRDFTEA